MSHSPSAAVPATTPRYQPRPFVELKHPDWSCSATIYEVNLRQFTPEGTFKAFASHLPRLKNLGVDILWLMPIHPIGVKNRKGTLGSYYAVRDYYGVNPEFGTLADFKTLVNEIHALGMYVILDWVANHSAWDNPLVTEHPKWYTKTATGDFQPTPWYDWEDIIDFDYDQPGLRRYMTEAMTHWVRETDIDGYRCDVAGFVPTDFWDNVRAELDAIKPVFMLAEWESRDLHRHAFDATYAWSLWYALHEVTVGGASFDRLIEYLARDVSAFPRDGYRMTFTDNHDKNSWVGNQFTHFGEALPLCMVLCCVVNGMPLIYGGQEAGLARSLPFFEKDEIEWQEHPFAGMYQKLFALKHRNRALWNGAAGGEMVRIVNDHPDRVISFFREKDGDRVVAVFNFSAQATTVELDVRHQAGTYTELFTEQPHALASRDSVSVGPWGYWVLTT